MRDERGEMSLIQLLIATAIFLMVMGATLTVFTSAERLNITNNVRNETDDAVRASLDQIARQLRNLASPTTGAPNAVDQAGPYDLVFQTVDPNGPNTGLNDTNVERVRYCLGAADGVIYRQEQKWTTQTTPAVPSTSACPSSDAQWSSTARVASYVRNMTGSRALFTFNAPTTTPSAITAIHVDAYVDQDPTHGPNETQLSTGVFLRNQNRAPSGDFTWNLAPGKIVLNGSLSSDPEGDTLTYVWYDNGVKITDGVGVRYDYAVAAGTTHAIQLKVYDSGNLEGDSAVKTVNVP